jgi:surfeit locus 1 family protein
MLRSTRLIAFVALAVGLAAFFVAMGFWQLARVDERRAANDIIRAALVLPSVPVASLGHANVPANRYVIVEGIPDYDHEFVHAGRSRNGSPGVHIFTPVRTGETTAVLVNRGWIYSADAATIDLARWREERQVFRGYTREMPSGDSVSRAPPLRRVRALSHHAIRPLIPYRLSRFYVVSQDSANERTPARLAEPELTQGRHLGYAIQWFCFAAIALIGAGVVVRRSVAR